MPTCSSSTLTNYVNPDTGHDTPSRHSIQTQVQPVVVLCIDVERYTGVHNFHFNVVGLDHPHTSKRSNIWCWYAGSQKFGRKCTHWVLKPRPVVCKPITLATRPHLLLFNKESLWWLGFLILKGSITEEYFRFVYKLTRNPVIGFFSKASWTGMESITGLDNRRVIYI